MAVDIEGLKMVLQAGKENPDLDMEIWSSSVCNTRGCLIGSFCLKHPDDALQIIPGGDPAMMSSYGVVLYGYHAISRRFGISILKAVDLFAPSKSVGSVRKGEDAIMELELFIQEQERAQNKA